MSLFDDIASEISSVVKEGPKGGSWYCCQECKHAYLSPELLRVCPKCQTQVNQWMGDTKEQAESRANRAAGISTTPAPTVTVTLVSESEAKELSKDAVVVDSGLLAPTPADQKQVEPEKPKRIRVKKEKVQEPAVTEEATPEPEPENNAEAKSPEEKKAERLAQIRAYAESRGLNGMVPVDIGTAVVQTQGFTIWNEGRPSYRFLEPHEEVADFNAEYNTARAMQPATQIDVVRCANCSDTEVHDLLFGGNIIASLNNGQGTQFVKRGQTVRIGAIHTDKGYLRFIVTGVENAK